MPTSTSNPPLNFLPPGLPPLLLTKRLTSFLTSNLHPHLQSSLLTTPSGKLLAYASSSPASLLRTQSTVAASLWASSSPREHHSSSSSSGASVSSYSHSESASAEQQHHPNAPSSTAVTFSLSSGAIVVMRRLTCGLLFVCMTAPTNGTDSGPAGAGSFLAAPPPPPGGGKRPSSAVVGSPSETESVGHVSLATTTTMGTSAGMGAVRRHVEELAKWLDDKLGALSVPEEGIGADLR